MIDLDFTPTDVAMAHARVTYDMRGIGRSDVPESGYTINEMASDALALLTELNIGSAHVAGYSLGGAIAQEMALRCPRRVNSLSLYSTYTHVEPYLRHRYELLIQILREGNPTLWAMFTAFSAYGEEYINAHDEELKREVELRRADLDAELRERLLCFLDRERGLHPGLGRDAAHP